MPERAKHLPLFIYGTLHPERAPISIAAMAKLLRAIGRARVQGRWYDLGEYPGVLLSDNPGDLVDGELFLMPEGREDEVLARLDTYEDYRPGDPASSLFVRERTVATLADGSQRICWVYLYNRPLN